LAEQIEKNAAPKDSENAGENNRDCTNIALMPSAAGPPVITVNGVYVHSPRDPVREGRRAAEALEGGEGPVVALGFGLGYGAEAAAEIFPKRPIIILERRIAVLRKALEVRDLRRFLSLHKIVFVLGKEGTDARAVTGALRFFEGKPVMLRNRPLMQLDGEWYAGAERYIKTWVSKDEVNRATLRKFGKRWVRNLSANMEAIRDFPGVGFLSSCLPPGMPVLLIAAGPSLDSLSPSFSAMAERAVVVAVDTALRLLLRNGVEPDFVLSVDPQFWNVRHLDRTSALKSVLIAESAVYPPALRHPFKQVFLCASLFPLGRFIEDRVDPKGALGAGGSVATTAWDFARSLGSAAIYIAGLDLSFPGFKTHFKGAAFEEKALTESSRFLPGETRSVHALRDGLPFSAPAADGGKVLTDRRLSIYAAWFENRFPLYPGLRNYSFSTRGLAIPGLIPAGPEALLSLPPRRQEIESLLNGIFARKEEAFNAPENTAARKARYDAARGELLGGLEKIRALGENAASLAENARRGRGKGGSRHAVAEPSRLSRALDELDKTNREITESEVKDVAGFLFPPMAELEGGLENKGSPNSPDSALEHHLELSAKFYRALSEAAEYHLKIFQNKRS
jgi:hypothetical protein